MPMKNFMSKKGHNNMDLLPSRLYYRYWNYTNSCSIELADFTAGREFHPALKISTIIIILYYVLLFKFYYVFINYLEYRILSFLNILIKRKMINPIYTTEDPIIRKKFPKSMFIPKIPLNPKTVL